jgi:MoaA/NifB/PqqE/SkfB family radical SAM enzyme
VSAVDVFSCEERRFFCPRPFEFAHIAASGDVLPCCPEYTTISYGNVLSDSVPNIWNSPQAQAMRATILDGSYAYCHLDACGYMQRGLLPGMDELTTPLHQRIVAQRLTTLDTMPQIYEVGYDLSCNLCCTFCRRHPIPGGYVNPKRVQRCHSELMKYGRDARLLILCGKGDPFASPLIWSWLRTWDSQLFPEAKIELQTNGLLFTPQVWASIERAHPAIVQVDISIDAATPETYAINRGGNFAVLMENLEFVSRLRRVRAFTTFVLQFIVQDNNYREIPAFVKLAESLGCDLVVFTRLEDTGVLTPQEYRKRAIHDPRHPQHAAFLAFIRTLVLKPGRDFLWNLDPAATKVDGMESADVWPNDGRMSKDDAVFERAGTSLQTQTVSTLDRP